VYTIPFGGGGVTLVEELVRKIGASSLATCSVASFIPAKSGFQYSAGTLYWRLAHVKNDVESTFGEYFSNQCLDCESTGRVELDLEHAYTVVPFYVNKPLAQG
jgi:hypothetical protein